LYLAEKNLVNRIENLMEQGDYIDEADARAAIEEVIVELGVKRDESQVNAAIMAICNPVSIITGGPGTGKSTTQKIIVTALRRLSRTLMAAAPTGRAAKRLTEVSGMDASTCHRLLSFDARAGGFLHSASNPFKIDRLIVDEFSMVDIKIASAFFDAIKPTAGITIVGDVDQLPSVGQGQVLRDMIESGRIPTTRLQTVHRQSGDSGIVIAASMINRGEYPDIDGKNIDGFELIDNFNGSYQDRNSEAAIRKTVVDLMAERLPAMGFNPLDDVQVLTPMRITDLGINVLNDDLKNRMNPMTEENGVNLGTQDDSVGDRVMHVRNDYEKSVFNGEVGFVDYIGEKINENGSKEQFIKVDYSGHFAFYKRSDISDIIPAWAATVHKSQGCEFPVAIIVCSNAHKRMLTRNLIYTAVTRAKKLCIVVGNRAALEHAVATADTSRRFTGLRQMLASGIGLNNDMAAEPDMIEGMSFR
jgi:exodeoxyribonuclease V alpha subunit